MLMIKKWFRKQVKNNKLPYVNMPWGNKGVIGQLVIRIYLVR